VPWELLPEALHPVLDQDPAGEVVRREALARLRTLVAGLPEDRRELLALRFAAGLSAAEIAAVVGAKEETVQKRLWRTLCALRERYDERT
jgi:RNA polymerase sigma-70 factor (ECF subfamily)